MSQVRITNLYDLMDSAYDAPQIHSISEAMGQKPIIDNNPRRDEKVYRTLLLTSVLVKEVVSKESTRTWKITTVYETSERKDLQR